MKTTESMLSRWERLLIATIPPSPAREALLGDLREEFSRRTAAESPRLARAWYRRQAVSILVRSLPGVPKRLARAAGGAMPGAGVIGADVSHAIRNLRRSPGFALAVLFILAVGLGANAAIFGLVRGVLFKSLGYPDADRVVTLWSTNSIQGWNRGGVSRQDADDWAQRARTFESIGVYAPMQGNASIGDNPVRVEYAMAGSEVFRALQVPAEMGRVLLPEDDVPGTSRPAVLSHRFWQEAFGGDRGAVGRTIRLDGVSFTIVGVMPAGFGFPSPSMALWTPFAAPPDATGPRIARWVRAVGRVRSETGLDAAQAEMDRIARELAQEYPQSNDGVGVLLEPQLNAETGGVRPLLLLAWVAVGLVLLTVCASVANLLLARASGRESEMVVRAALGAARARLVSQLLAESLLLSLGGGLLGILGAELLLPALRRLDAVAIPRLDSIGVDPWVLIAGVAASVLVGLGFGLGPAVLAARADPMTALRRGGRGVIGRGREQVRSGLIVLQVALAVIVLVGAGLLLRSFDRLSRVDPGFALGSRVTFRVAPDWGTWPVRRQGVLLYTDLLERLRGIPGVEAVGAVNRLPLTGSWWNTDYAVEGATVEPGKAPVASYRVITPGYFTSIGIPLLRGRDVQPADADSALRVTVVSRFLAERAWPGEDPIGKRISFDPWHHAAPLYTVVGVVGDVHTSGLADDPEPLAYVSMPQAQYGHFGDWGMDVVLKAAGDPAVLLEAARQAVHTLAPGLPPFEARPLTALLADDLARRRLLLRLLGGLGFTAALLSVLGLYGVIAYGVHQRRSELGVRMALGAAPSRVRQAVVRRGAALASLGVVLGLAASAGVTRYLVGQLYGVEYLDPLTFLAVGVALLLAAVVASWLPAYRASRVSPVEALRSE